MRLKDKVAFITGAAQGIGAAAATKFAGEGALVVVADINDALGRDTVGLIRSQGGDALFVHCDTTQEDSVEAAVEAAVTHYGALDILYNNVGGSTPNDGPVTTVAMEEFWRCIKLELLSTFLVSRHGIRAMQRAGRGGSVINTATYVAVIGTAGRDCYTAAKGAIISLTKSMAVEYAPDRIRVNAVAPGAVVTQRMTDFYAKNPTHPVFAESNRHRRPHVPSHLLGLIETEDIANMALFLASEESRRITGTIQLIDSGATAS
ncbi:MAG: SDR family oxidoreductase [Gemmatimonadaceae bacterium]|nr:SDR family oxidoreductase [Gemmatimonadaceae bacterium]